MDEKKINILGLNDLTGAELQDLGDLLKLQDVKKKSNVNLLNEINHLAKLFLAGQVNYFFKAISIKVFLLKGPCHKYVHKRGQTAGFTDAFCQHSFKIASKLLSGQETVADPASILNSMPKIPIGHFCGKNTYITRTGRTPNPVKGWWGDLFPFFSYEAFPKKSHF